MLCMVLDACNENMTVIEGCPSAGNLTILNKNLFYNQDLVDESQSNLHACFILEMGRPHGTKEFFFA